MQLQHSIETPGEGRKRKRHRISKCWVKTISKCAQKRTPEQSNFCSESRMLALAGAGGIEPPNGGIKIRCLTAWLRPIRLIWERPQDSLSQIPAATARLPTRTAHFNSRPGKIAASAAVSKSLYITDVNRLASRARYTRFPGVPGPILQESEAFGSAVTQDGPGGS